MINFNTLVVAKNVGLATAAGAGAAAFLAAEPAAPDSFKPDKGVVDFFKSKEKNPWFGTGPLTFASGVAMLAIYNNPTFGKLGQWRGIQFASYAIMAGGALGSALAAYNTLSNSASPPAGPQVGMAQPLDRSAPATLKGLELRELARARVESGKGYLWPSIYIDPNKATEVRGGVEDAYEAAITAAASDSALRSFAVLQTSDGKFWIAPFAKPTNASLDKGGAIERVDGPKYDDPSSLGVDKSTTPFVKVLHDVLIGIAGVDNTYRLREPKEAQ